MKAMAAKANDRYGAAGELRKSWNATWPMSPSSRPDRGLDHLFRVARRHRAWRSGSAWRWVSLRSLQRARPFRFMALYNYHQLAEESAVRNLEMAEAGSRKPRGPKLKRCSGSAPKERKNWLASVPSAPRRKKICAEREKRIVQMMVAEHAPDLLRLPGGYFADRQSVADFTAALVTARQADPQAEEQNREALATFARLLRKKSVSRRRRGERG